MKRHVNIHVAGVRTNFDLGTGPVMITSFVGRYIVPDIIAINHIDIIVILSGIGMSKNKFFSSCHVMFVHFSHFYSDLNGVEY